MNTPKIMKRLVPAGVRRRLRPYVLGDEFGLTAQEARRLARAPRHQHMQSRLLGKRVELSDAFWYLHMYNEIFRRQIYRFVSDHPTPSIIDCGANIGMSVIYFKHLYPGSHIVAFEPDAQVFRILETNVETFELEDVHLHQKAVWTSETVLEFQPDGAVGGRLVKDGDRGSRIRVPTTRLKNYLDKPVDFLKVDIEGAEREVMRDCRDGLQNVGYLFVEYHGRPNERQSLQDLLQMLQDAGFRYYLKEENPIERPFVEGRSGRQYDLQLSVFAFRA